MSYDEDQGRKAELTIVKIIENWRRSKKPFRNGRKIVYCQHANKNDSLDKGGVDILIFLDCGLALPLQIKSCLTSSSLKKHRLRYPHVRFIISLEAPKIRKHRRRHASATAQHFVAKELEELINQAITDVTAFSE